MSEYGKVPRREGIWGLHHDDIVELDTHEFDLEQFTPNLQRALTLAAYAHEGQRRKLADIPSLSHPYETMLMLTEICDIDPYTVQEESEEEAMLMGALLHDAVEDSEGRVSSRMIAEFFGGLTAQIVDLATRDKERSDEEYFVRLNESRDSISSRVIAADKMHALTCRIREFYRMHEETEDAFTISNAEKAAYYQGILDAIQDNIQADDLILILFQELIDAYSEQISIDGVKYDGHVVHVNECVVN